MSQFEPPSPYDNVVFDDELPDWAECWVPPRKQPPTPVWMKPYEAKPSPGRYCDTCGDPFIPKHWEPEYTTCLSCHYGT
jgi:hypothetical protein